MVYTTTCSGTVTSTTLLPGADFTVRFPVVPVSAGATLDVVGQVPLVLAGRGPGTEGQADLVLTLVAVDPLYEAARDGAAPAPEPRAELQLSLFHAAFVGLEETAPVPRTVEVVGQVVEQTDTPVVGSFAPPGREIAHRARSPGPVVSRAAGDARAGPGERLGWQPARPLSRL